MSAKHDGIARGAVWAMVPYRLPNGAESAPCDLCIVWGMLNAVIGRSARGAVPGDCPRKGAAMEFTSASASKYLRRLQELTFVHTNVII